MSSAHRVVLDLKSWVVPLCPSRNEHNSRMAVWMPSVSQKPDPPRRSHPRPRTGEQESCMRMAPSHSEPRRMADQRRKGSPRPARGSPARRTHDLKCDAKHAWRVTRVTRGVTSPRDRARFCKNILTLGRCKTKMKTKNKPWTTIYSRKTSKFSTNFL